MIQKKAGVFVGFLFLIILFLGVVSSQGEGTCGVIERASCTGADNYIIMGLSSDTNAHGQVYDATPAYPYVLCCNLPRTSATRSCTGSNIESNILDLSSTTNAHAEIPEGTAYATEVCFGDLICESQDTTNPHSETHSPILSLSGDGTNAHIAEPNEAAYTMKVWCNLIPTFCGDGDVQNPNNDGDMEDCEYDWLNCIQPGQEGQCTCIEGYEPNIITKTCEWAGSSVVYWSNVSSADRVRISDLPDGIIVGQTTVYAIFEEFFLDDGIPVTFTIKENDVLIDDTLRTIETTTTDGIAIAEWTITYEDIQNANQGGEETEYEFYFEYSYSQGSGDSGILTGSVVEAPVCQAITMCMDYRVQDQCEGDLTRCNVSETSVEANTNIDCDDLYIDCECWWNESDGGQCGSRWISTEEGEEGTCSYTTFTDDDCEDMLLTYTFLANWTSTAEPPDPAPDSCQTGYNSIPCATKVQLPFFNIYNLIVVIVIIVLIYLALNLKKKKKPVRVEKKRKKK